MSIKIIWFNRQKGFGEGTSPKGKVYFFTLYHVDPKDLGNLSPDKTIKLARKPKNESR